MNPLILSLTLFGSLEQEMRLSDQFRCDLAPGVVEVLRAQKSAWGDSRLILDLRPMHGGYGGGVIEREVIESSTPIASWSLAGDSVTVDLDQGQLIVTDPELSYPGDWDALGGEFLLRPALIVSAGEETGAIRVEGPEGAITLRAGESELIDLELDTVIREPDPESDATPPSGMLEVMFESSLLSEHHGYGSQNEEHLHRAWVVLPLGYHDLNASRRMWPVIYLIPGRSSAKDFAASIAKLAREHSMKRILPQAIWVVLEKQTRYGHHFFLDSALHGPRSRALVEEFIPWIDVRFRTIPQVDARLLVGEEQGGFSVLHLLAEHEETFSDAWAISPEAVSLDSLGTIDLYGEGNAFALPDGGFKPALRSPLGSERELIHLEVWGEVMRTQALDPTGRSTGRWNELCAAFGGRPSTNRESWWPFDPTSGELRPVQVNRWKQFDLARRARMDPSLALRLNQGARILCGEQDECYRNLGIESLDEAIRTSVSRHGFETALREWVTQIDAASSIEAGMIATMRRNEEIMEVLRTRGHHE